VKLKIKILGSMIRVFVSSTFKDLIKERQMLLDRLNATIEGMGVGMEDFYPDGNSSHEICIGKLRNSQIAIILISPKYGTFIDECKIENCKYKSQLNRCSISFTHCEIRVTVAENKLHQIYLVDKDWDILKELKEWKEIDWQRVKNNRLFDGKNPDEIEHYYSVAKNALELKDEAEKREFCKRVKDIENISDITKHLANNIVKWYSEGKLNLEDFFGRGKELKDLIEKMSDSVEVSGVGGIGKTTLIHIALIIQSLKGKKIITVGTEQSYSSGSGYRYFNNKWKNLTLRNIITIDDILNALSVPENIKMSNGTDEKIRYVSQKLKNENAILFIDDFHLADNNVQKLVKSSEKIVIATKSRTGVARNELQLLGIDQNYRGAFIDRIAENNNQIIAPDARQKIIEIADGHPVSTEILIKNYKKINFEELEEYKPKEFSNDKQVEEFMERVVKGILSIEAFELLKNLSIINPELENNIDRKALKKTYPKDFDKTFNELIDASMLEKRNEGVYQFTYRHIRDILRDNNKEKHELAKSYYENKMRKDLNDEAEILFHRSISNPDETLINDFLKLKVKLMPIHYGFRRLIDVGRLLKESSNTENKAAVCATLGNIYNDLKKFENAEKAFIEALSSYKELAKKSPDAYLPYVAMTQNNLGVLYRNFKKFENAEKAFTEALNSYKELAKKSPDAYLPDVAMTQNNFGVLYRNLKKFGDAERAYTEALNSYKELAKRSPDAYLPYVAATQNNLGNLYRNLKKFEDAEKASTEALKIRMELAKKSPDTYLPDVAMIQNNLGNLYGDLNKFEDAEKAFTEALKIRMELAIKSPDAYLPDVAVTQNDLGLLYFNLNKFMDAEKAFTEALKIRMELAKKNHDAYLPDVAATQNNLGLLYWKLNKFKDAEKPFTEALNSYKELAKKNPDAYLPYVAGTQDNLGILYRNLKKFEDAEKAFTEALKIRKELAKKSPDAYLPDVATTQNNIGVLYWNLRKFEDAEKASSEALKIRKQLAKRSPDAYLPYVATTQNNLGNIYNDLKMFEAAEKAYTEALKIRMELAKKSPDAYLPYVARTQNNLGNLYRNLKKFEDAEKAFTEALKIRKELAKKNPDAYLPDVAMTQNNLGILYRDLNKSEEAEKAYTEALKIRKELEENGSNPA
jgi:tetratricopeptide (TPR) repeat protein